MFSVPPILNFVLRRYARTILSVFYSTTAKLTKNVQFVYLKKSKFQLYSNSFFDFFFARQSVLDIQGAILSSIQFQVQGSTTRLASLSTINELLSAIKQTS